MAEESDADIQIPSAGEVACHNCGRPNDVSQRRAFSIAQCAHCGAVFPVPGKLDNFLLVRVVSRGAICTTYRAHDDLLGRQVAVKVLNPDAAENKAVAKAFKSEARALGSLNHPNVVQVYSLSMTKRPHYVALELVPPQHLGHLFSKDQPLDEVRALDIAIQAAEGLQAAAGVGLVHGSLTPDKVALDEEGTAKLAEFGQAQVAAEAGSDSGPLGAPYYVAPEQVAGKPIDHRTDVYSLGATLFHALTGRPPFRGGKAEQVARARLKGPAPDARSLRRSLHRGTSAILARMLQADPDRRYDTYEDLLADLREARAAATRPEPPETSADLELAKAALRDWHRGRTETARSKREAPIVAEPADVEEDKPAGRPAAPRGIEPAPTRQQELPAAEVLEHKPDARALPVAERIEQPQRPRRLRPIAVWVLLLGIGGGLVGVPYLMPGDSSSASSVPEGASKAPPLPASAKAPARVTPPPRPRDLPDPGPVPPLPDVYVSDLRFTRETVARGRPPKKNRNVEGKSLNVDGKTYTRGLGVHAPSELVFPRRAGHKRFVAVVGIDGISHPTPAKASIVCEIRAGRRTLVKSPVLRWNGRRHWHFNVRLPARCKQVRLVVTDAGDGIRADLANWVNAGFKK